LLHFTNETTGKLLELKVKETSPMWLEKNLLYTKKIFIFVTFNFV
jgi:hypothetical protein